MSHTRFGFQARNTPAERRAFFDLIRNDHRTTREMEALIEAVQIQGNEALTVQRSVTAYNTNSTTYVNLPATAMTTSLTKIGTGPVFIEVHGSGFANGVAGALHIGVDCPTVGVQDMGIFFFNDLSSHRSFSFVREVTGIPAGAGTYGLRCLSGNAAMFAHFDVNDYLSLHVRELA